MPAANAATSCASLDVRVPARPDWPPRQTRSYDKNTTACVVPAADRSRRPCAVIGEANMMVARALALLLLTASLGMAGVASAQPYPSRPVTLIVPYPPGGATDAISRIIQDSMSQSLGQQLVVENVG